MGLNKYQKDSCTSLDVALYQKSIFDFLNPFMGYFQDYFFYKTMVFVQMQNTIWQRAK